MSRCLNISNGNTFKDWSIDKLKQHRDEQEYKKRAPQDLIIG